MRRIEGADEGGMVASAQAAAGAAAAIDAAAADAAAGARQPPWLALLALAGLTIVWGVTWVVAKLALADAPPFALAAQRCTGAALALLLALKLSGRPLAPVAPGATLAISLAQVLGFMALQNWALYVTGPGKTAVLIFTMPIWTLLLAWVVLGERVRGLQWLAAASTLGGLVLVIAPWSLRASWAGQALGVGAAMCWALGSVLVKRLRARRSVDLLALTTWQMLFAVPPLAALALLVPEPATHWSATYVASLAFMTLVSTAAGWWLWIYILDRLPAWEASLSVLGTPVVAIVTSALLLGERFRLHEIAGMALIGIGLALLSLLGWLAAQRPGHLAR